VSFDFIKISVGEGANGGNNDARNIIFPGGVLITTEVVFLFRGTKVYFF
jgi:hypothetical protein